jgi:hypothetical protein
MLHVLHVIQIIEVLLCIEALHVKALHFKANCMDFLKNKRPLRETYVLARSRVLIEILIKNCVCLYNPY